jgi:hypothetical protein
MWNRIKKKLNRKRSRLGEEYVEILMLISMEGPDDESMNLNRARQLFNSEKNRRIKKTWDTENLCDCPKVCGKNTDFRINATDAS